MTKDDYTEISVTSADGWTCKVQVENGTEAAMREKLSQYPAIIINNYAQKVKEMLDPV